MTSKTKTGARGKVEVRRSGIVRHKEDGRIVVTPDGRIQSGAGGEITFRGGGAARIKENGRIVATTKDGITSLSYRGKDPRTRYLPREESVWKRIKDAFMMG